MHFWSCGSKPVHNTLPCGMAFQVEDGYRKSVHHEDTGLDTMKTAGSNLKYMSGIVIITVEPRYFKLSCPELPAILKRIGFFLDVPLFFQSFAMGYLELGHLEHSPFSVSRSPSLKSNLANPNFITFWRNTTSVRKWSQGWQSWCTES